MDFDVAVLGGGPAGYTAAIRAAQLGARVACVEREAELGGTCLRVGCIPTKAWVSTAHALHAAREIDPKLGVVTGEPELDFATANEWKAQVVKQMTGGVASLFKANNVQWLEGSARFEDARSIVFDKGELGVSFKSAIVATGSFRSDRRSPGSTRRAASTRRVCSSRPRYRSRLVVLGGGIIGCEFASIFERFGTEVTIDRDARVAHPARGRRRDERAAEVVRAARDRRPPRQAVHEGRGHGHRARRPLRRGRDDGVRPDARLGRPRAARRGHRPRGSGRHVRPRDGHRDRRAPPNLRSAHLRRRRRRRLLAARAHRVPRRRDRGRERDGARGADAGLSHCPAADLHRPRDRRRRTHRGAGGREVRRREHRRRPLPVGRERSSGHVRRGGRAG